MKKLKSITTKSVYGNATKKDIGKIIMQVQGYITGSFKHQTMYGEQTGLKGDFVAVNAKGEKFVSEAAFLPKDVTDQALARLQEGEVDIRFAVSIGVQASDKNSQGIAYVTQEPITEERKNRMAELLEVVDANTKLLLEHNNAA